MYTRFAFVINRTISQLKLFMRYDMMVVQFACSVAFITSHSQNCGIFLNDSKFLGYNTHKINPG